MKKFFKFGCLGIIALIVLIIILVVAFSGNDDNVSTKSKSGSSEQASSEENTKESKVGTRSNPVKLNEVATIETSTYDDESNSYNTTIDLSVEKVIRGEEAQSQLKKMNEFNEDAPEGYEWVLVDAKVKVADSETEDYPFSIDGIMYFDFVSESGDIYSGDIVGTTEPDFSFEMYKGNEKQGYIAGLVKTGEKATLQYDPMVSSSVFFNLQ
ncbi:MULTISPECIES: hypothetical protein [unclassified Niallia]|uniref:hypothetical protein n=1 Tax=unclassified Niallia TaxID=2837522 RepID=UPI001EDA9135|nr:MULTISPECIES: hypothetical protein [unclassified Niallia]MDL0436223.1 hypothetical protein [Niallia sp. SS-2023]UPO86781.1 hypothetical protein L8T27_014445 [Niallia sp. Man26]